MVEDPLAYVRGVLAREAADIPSALVLKRGWCQAEVAPSALRPDLAMLELRDVVVSTADHW
ncbi:hypothetical protein [Actinopolymorpha alba]|uniref:hypothetical protein n=1 Tax=Actinopolymorpha alba TaxID=533267 RepID=UPI0003A524E6|nr:hypothetical protein [Actinopolymorpha alba]